jgi:hypothetical protein
VTIGSFGIELMPMKRHDDSQRSDRSVTRATSTVCTAGRLQVHEEIAVDVSCAGPHTTSSPIRRTVMRRHDDSQRSERLAVTLGNLGNLRVVDRVAASIPSLSRLGFDGDLRVVDRRAAPASIPSLSRLGFDGDLRVVDIARECTVSG